VVLNLWATECGGCKTELPTFVEMNRVYKDKGLVVVGVSMDIMYSDLRNAKQGWGQVNPFVKAHGIDYPILLDDGSVEKAFKVTALPATYLVDRAGRIAASYVGVVDPSDLERNIKTLLAER
jgi:cytochrome c biogenesis protein CcmG/thiol:disulfide interchange protein DsbE